MDLARSSANGRVLLMHRRDAFSATPERVARMRDLCARGYMTFMVGQVTGVEAEGGTLTAALVLGPDGETHRVPVSAMLVRLGFSPRLGPIAHWGLDMARKQLVVDTEKFATSTPGIFAVGDVNTYPGKRKLIVCGFHECTLAAFGAMSIIRPQAPVWLQYTTTSPRLLRLLESAPR
jgi:thioredoxin reductase (NADPH)